jgi:hypothetical protein
MLIVTDQLPPSVLLDLQRPSTARYLAVELFERAADE